MPSSSYPEDYQHEHDEEPSDTIEDRLAYPTIHSSCPINAISGKPYPFQLGTSKQLGLFEVRSTAGWIDSVGAPVKPGADPQKDPVRLFYDTPKQYVYHRAMALGMGTSEDDIEHLMRYGFGSQPGFDLEGWAEMTRLWRSRQTN
jgi:hypothetical protein